jgi:dimethylhistidine N-methyltransferase
MPDRAAREPQSDRRGNTLPADELAEILAGLRQQPKNLSPKFFYDERGSALFEKITELPEYYLTRAELSIMETHVGEIAALAGPKAILLAHLDRLAACVPVDISREHLLAAAGKLAAEFPQIEVLPVAADFTQPFRLPQPKVMPLRNIVYFPGSTIGNFGPDAALGLLRVMHQEAAEDGALLIGVDLKKDPAILERAYNDSQGVTAAFNLNMLRRLNREFGADFDLDAFEHRAIYDEALGRIEMHVVSLREQIVSIGDETFRFRKGETILTECSYKYTVEEFGTMAGRAGFAVHTVWTDAERLFSVQYCLRT